MGRKGKYLKENEDESTMEQIGRGKQKDDSSE